MQKLLKSLRCTYSNRLVMALSIGLVIALCYQCFSREEVGAHIYHQRVDPQADELQFVWKKANGGRYASIGGWKEALQESGKELTFATNGGMYTKEHSPVGLYIEKGNVLSEIDRSVGKHGNFYLQPNGIFFVRDDGSAGIEQTKGFATMNAIQYATQSGPMLVIDGVINEVLGKESKSTHIRNGVGILANGELLFAMSSTKVNFYRFAQFFKEQGCVNALYLDGFVSRMYAPNGQGEKVEQQDGDFGVMIGVVE